MCDNHWLWFSYTKATVNPNVKWYWCVNSKSREKNYIREGCWKKPSKYELFPKLPQPPPPFEKWTFWKQFLIFFLNRISQSESQNLRLVNFVPYKLIFLTVLTRKNKILKIWTLGSTPPPPPLLEKVHILRGFFAPFPYHISKLDWDF